MCLSNVSQKYKTAVSSEVPNSSTQTPPAKIPGYYQGPTVPKKNPTKKVRERIPPWMSTMIKGKVKNKTSVPVSKCQLDFIKQFRSNHHEMAQFEFKAKGFPVFDTSLVSRFQFHW